MTNMEVAAQCACPVVSEFLCRWDDDLPDNETRNRLLRPLTPRLAGSKSTAAVESRRSMMALDWLCRTHLPAWLELGGLGNHAQTCRDLAELRDDAAVRAARPTLDAAWRAARGTARAGVAALGAVRAAAGVAVWHAAGIAAGDAVWDEARNAARVAAWHAARAATGNADMTAVRDEAWAAAWDAVWHAAGIATGSEARDAAWAAAWDAAGVAVATVDMAALKSTIRELQQSALELIDRMLAVKE